MNELHIKEISNKESKWEYKLVKLTSSKRGIKNIICRFKDAPSINNVRRVYPTYDREAGSFSQRISNGLKIPDSDIVWHKEIKLEEAKVYKGKNSRSLIRLLKDNLTNISIINYRLNNKNKSILRSIINLIKSYKYINYSDYTHLTDYVNISLHKIEDLDMYVTITPCNNIMEPIENKRLDANNAILLELTIYKERDRLATVGLFLSNQINDIFYLGSTQYTDFMLIDKMAVDRLQNKIRKILTIN